MSLLSNFAIRKPFQTHVLTLFQTTIKTLSPFRNVIPCQMFMPVIYNNIL